MACIAKLDSVKIIHLIGFYDWIPVCSWHHRCTWSVHRDVEHTSEPLGWMRNFCSRRAVANSRSSVRLCFETNQGHSVDTFYYSRLLDLHSHAVSSLPNLEGPSESMKIGFLCNHSLSSANKNPNTLWCVLFILLQNVYLADPVLPCLRLNERIVIVLMMVCDNLCMSARPSLQPCGFDPSAYAVQYFILMVVF